MQSTAQTLRKPSTIITLVIGLTVIAIFLVMMKVSSVNSLVGDIPEPPAILPTDIWKIRSVDTMKTSRDMARAKLHDTTFDATIAAEMKIIKDLGANYVAIGTPYDEEFLPFLKRWVKSAREHDLKIWYRGTFSGYEGWFDYPKTMSPDQLLTKTQEFVAENPDLFEEDDIFDPCPECENAGYWPQPTTDDNYNAFMRQKHLVLKEIFAKMNKRVITNLSSVIGGRAKDVLKQETFDNIDNIVALDHYAATAKNYDDYVQYFADQHNTKVVFSEFGAPIPDLHGAMTEKQQSDFISQVFGQLYKHKDSVLGVNYWVLSNGTTAIVNPDNSLRSATEVIQDYFKPGIIKGTIRNTASEKLGKIKITTADGVTQTYTQKNGNYQFVVPAGTTEFMVEDANYHSVTQKVEIDRDETKVYNFDLEPKKTNFFYYLRVMLNRRANANR